MCIAIYKLKGNDVPCEKWLKNSWDENPDGAGFAFNDNGNVRIVKGLMTWDSFKATFDEYNKRYNFKNRGLLIHFRIQTHGGICPECTHPFPISSDEGALQKTQMISPYAVIHNGIITLTSATARTKDKMSDTMCFIQKYLTKIAANKRWFYIPENMELIYDLIDSKMAILNGAGEIKATYGFTKDEKDGNYYSNTTYKYERSYVKYVGRAYNWGEDDYYGSWDEYYDKKYGWGKYSSVKEVSSTGEKKEETTKTYAITNALMIMKRGEQVVMEDGSVYDYDPTIAIYMDEWGEIFYGEPEDGPWLRKAVSYCGCGDIFDAGLKPKEFRADHWIDEKNVEYDGEEEGCPYDEDEAEIDTKIKELEEGNKKLEEEVETQKKENESEE